MVNIDEEIVDKVLEDTIGWLQLLRNKRNKKFSTEVTPFELTLVRKIMLEAENILIEAERKENWI